MNSKPIEGSMLMDDSALEYVIGGVSRDASKREEFVSAFYCEACGKTVHMGMIYSLDRAKKEHYAKVHPGMLYTNA